PIQQLQDELMQTMDILIEHRMEISPHQLVPLFRQANLAILNYFYLFRLQSVDVTMVQDFGNELVELYANFNRLQLLPFLTHNDNYDVDLAIETCQLREYFSELVYLLGKIGENKRAINLVIHKLDDAKLAIEFATRLKDQDTWDIVIDESMTRPHFIRQLIELSDLDESINQFYDPMTILNKLDVDKMGDMKDESEQLLKRSVMEYDSRQQLNQLINQIILRMILNKSQQVAQVLKDMLLRGIAVNFEDETDLTKKREWEQIVQRYEAIVL
ncbi:CLH domain-containing protein, partial [Acetobacter pasteurianus]|nr:CLH domain-containing protein [Acetobacter pasteurianus]